MATIDASAGEQLSVTTAIDAIYAQAAGADEQLSVTTAIDAIYAQAAGVSESMTLSFVGQPAPGFLLRDGVALVPILAPQTTYHLTMAEATSIRDRLLSGTAVALSDVTQIGAAVVSRLGLILRDRVDLAEALAGAGRFRRGYSETVRLSDVAGQAALGAIAEAIGIAGTLQGVALFDQLLTDTIEAGDSITSAPLLMQVVAADTVDITATDALQMLYAGRLGDTVQVTAAYPSPGGSVTTWALNTKTSALTEYGNYAFNSFARLGRRHLGASETGLYELTGDTDDGDAIIAELETGDAQIAGSRFTSFRAAYLAVRGDGRFILRLKTGGGKVYNYEVTTDNLETTKVNLGKGLRARYFSFTLISTGQDFDLESLEFVPIAAKRRV